ncbi:energy transducer TonB [Stakelama sp. CBK3Z-3]|uniref:Energy transducer TonB n=1 Tax=Stakelama flava TaxID=2860338 RepID=A0ABS6XL04_9SPHN|nr:energy transducer TonB [Stakelama flava]MBW4330887.1 energy transducer TonB [Stakelama flava]
MTWADMGDIDWKRLRDRHGAPALASAASITLLAVLLIIGLRVPLPHRIDDSLSLFTVTPPPAPPPVRPHTGTSTAAPAKTAPPAKKADPVSLAAPAPIIPLKLTPPAPPVPGYGAQSSAGAAHAGSGSGAGGVGSGRGSGDGGSGTGTGLAAPSERIAGAITPGDYPAAARRANAQGTVIVTYRVETDGRARDCRIMASSGNTALDQTTCRLIEKRFRFRPARDSTGEPIAETRGWQQRWWFAP